MCPIQDQLLINDAFRYNIPHNTETEKNVETKNGFSSE